jgi:hypothetical protein
VVRDTVMAAERVTRAGAGRANVGGLLPAVLRREAEGAHRLHQRLGLLAHALRRCRRFLHRRGVLLHHPVHLGDGLVHLLHAAALLGRGLRDRRHELGDALHVDHQRLDGVARLLDQLRAVGDLLDRVADEVLDLLGGPGAPLREAAHFRGHDREAAPLLSARAASTAALSARMLVWKAIESITETMSVIFFALSLISVMVVTTRTTSAPPCSARFEALRASSSAWRALSAFCFTVLASCSMLAAVCWRLEACSSVRCERSVVPAETWLEAVTTASAEVRTCEHPEAGIAHLAHHAQQVAGLVVGARLDLGGEVAFGEALAEAHGFRDRREHGAADEEVEEHEGGDHRDDRSGDRDEVRAIGRLHGPAHGERPRVLSQPLGLVQQAGDRLVDAPRGVVASERILVALNVSRPLR